MRGTGIARPAFIGKPHGRNRAVAGGPYGRGMRQPATTTDGGVDRSRTGDGMPRYYLRACLLLILAEMPAHGYDMAERLGRFGLGAVDKGGMYRTLRVMEEEGLVTSGWEQSPTGPLRRSYHITDDGRGWLETWAEGVRNGQVFAAVYLRRYQRVRRTLPAGVTSSPAA